MVSFTSHSLRVLFIIIQKTLYRWHCTVYSSV